MPRELIHWSVLERSIEILRVQGEERIVSCFEENRAAAMLGAVTHDAPYYHRLGRSEFSRAAEYLHGTDGEDTFGPMRIFHRLAQEQRSPAQHNFLLAFLAGLLSHIAADAVFHPMVYYFSGNYYHPLPEERMRAQRDHRLLEVFLDSWLEQQEHSPQLSIRLLVRDSSRHEPMLAQALDAMCQELRLPSSTAHWHQSIHTLAWAQQVFRSTLAGAIFRSAKTLFPQLSNEDALFRFGRTTAPAWLTGSFTFRNPVSGEETSTDLHQLLEKAALDASRYIRIFLGTGEAARETGPSLNFGMPNVSREAFAYSEPKLRSV